MGHAGLRRADRPVAQVEVRTSVLAMCLAVRPTVYSWLRSIPPSRSSRINKPTCPSRIAFRM